MVKVSWDALASSFRNKKVAQQQEALRLNYRQVYVNQELPENLRYDSSTLPLISYPRNKIRTSKYTPVSFLPKNLFFQFTNIANSYFLLIVILGAFQIFGVPSPALSAVPLIVIVVLTLIKDAFEDYRRAISDLDLNNSRIHLLVGLDNHNYVDYVGPWRRFKKFMTRITIGKLMDKRIALQRALTEKGDPESAGVENEGDLHSLRRTSTVISNRFSTDRRSHHLHTLATAPLVDKEFVPPSEARFKTKNWKDIHVGDFIRVRNNEEVPADVIIISTSDLETGGCYVETKNLDGETNLKSRKLVDCGEGIKHAVDLASTRFWVEVEQPNTKLYSFKGVVHYTENGVENTEPVTNDNVLLRGYTLRNTKWALGLVVYTGPETKIMLNSGITPTKKSKISRELNLSVVINFVLLFVLCFISAMVNGFFYDKTDTSRRFFEYRSYGGSPPVDAIIQFFVALIIYQSLVPISLYISIEIVKSVQLILIYADTKMYYEPLDYPCTPKSWNISDDLGQIEYVFSDKTGTLTQNVMEFKKCTINGKSYGNCYTEARMGMDKRAGIDIVAKLKEMKQIIDKEKADMIVSIEQNFRNDQFDPEDLTMISADYMDDILTNKDNQGRFNEQFMLALALCHTVVTEVDPDTNRIIFKAESPDESALVSVARDLGFVFIERSRNTVKLQKYDAEPIEIKVLSVIPFTSLRKRMSCIFEIDGKSLIITKGADNVIYERLSKENSRDMITKTALHLEEFAEEGLRTLCIAQKELDPAFVKEWLVEYNDALSSIDVNRDELIDSVTAKIETDLILLGGTAIEDRLQDMVPESIRILGNAGIKLWVLTGDKVETAINIGFSCNLLDTSMKLLVIKLFDKDEDEDSGLNDFKESTDELLTKYLREEFHMEGSDEELKLARKEHSTPKSNCGIVIDGGSLTEIFDPNNKILQRKFLLLAKQCKSVLCCRVSPLQKALVVKLVKEELKVMTLAIGDGANDVAMIQAANIGVGIAGEEGRQLVMSSDYAIAQFRFLTRLLLVHGRWSYKRLAEMIPCFFYKNLTFTTTLFWYGIFNNFDGSYLMEYTYLMFYNLAFTSLPVIFLAFLDQDVNDTVSLLTPQLYKSGILGLEWSQYKFVYYMMDGAYQSVISFFFPYLVYYKGNFVNSNGLVLDHRFWIGVVVAHIAVVSNNLYVLLQQKRWDYLTLIINALSILVIFFWTGVWSAGIISEEFYRSGAQVFGSTMFWCCFAVGVVSCLLPRFIFDNIRRLYFPRDIDIVRERVKMGYYKSYPRGYDPTNFEDVEAHRNLLYTRASSGAIDVDNEKQEFENSDEISSAKVVENTTPDTVLEQGPKRENSVVNRLRSMSKSMRPPNFRLPHVQRFGKHDHQDELLVGDDIESIRALMRSSGQLSRNSLERIRTSHQVGGLTQAESLLERYSTRGSTLR